MWLTVLQNFAPLSYFLLLSGRYGAGCEEEEKCGLRRTLSQSIHNRDMHGESLFKQPLGGVCSSCFSFRQVTASNFFGRMRVCKATFWARKLVLSLYSQYQILVALKIRSREVSYEQRRSAGQYLRKTTTHSENFAIFRIWICVETFCWKCDGQSIFGFFLNIFFLRRQWKSMHYNHSVHSNVEAEPIRSTMKQRFSDRGQFLKYFEIELVSITSVFK